MLDHRYHISAVLYVANISATQARAYVVRNGALPDVFTGGKWRLLSVIDVCVFLLIRDLASIGLTAQAAVDYAKLFRPYFERLAKGDSSPPHVAMLEDDPADLNPDLFYPGDDAPLAEAIDEASASGVALTIDAREVFNRAVKRLTEGLEAGAFPAVAPEGTAAAVMARAIIDAFRPDPEEGAP